jgi:hypothetical protein
MSTKPNRHDAYHIPPEHALPCASYHPLTDHELGELRKAFLGTRDFYTSMTILRRIEQSVAGMMTPIHCSGPATIECALLAVNTFCAWAHSGDPELRANLHIQLGIQAELQLEEAA